MFEWQTIWIVVFTIQPKIKRYFRFVSGEGEIACEGNQGVVIFLFARVRCLLNFINLFLVQKAGILKTGRLRFKLYLNEMIKKKRLKLIDSMVTFGNSKLVWWHLNIDAYHKRSEANKKKTVIAARSLMNLNCLKFVLWVSMQNCVLLRLLCIERLMSNTLILMVSG